MRIVAGEYASRRIKTLDSDSTRPTLDKVREAVFSSLGGFFDGGAVLDLYAGSGACGLEALSRGMDFAVFCDRNRAAAEVIRENIALLKAEQYCRVLNMADNSALNLLRKEGAKFDLVYLDPPYRKQHNMEILWKLDEADLVSDGGRVVIESLKEDQCEAQVGPFILYKEAVYGISKISYYRCERKE